MKKWQIIDLVRSFCVAGVVASHSYVNFPFHSPWTSFCWGHFSNNGRYAVFLFFMVSGFLITHVLANNPSGLFKPDLVRFYVQRAGRIWPLYFLIFGLGLLLYGFGSPESPLFTQVFSAGRDYGPWFWISIPSFTFNWFLAANSTWAWGLQWIILWSVAVEEQFYLLYPLVLKKTGNPRNLYRLLLGMVLAAVLFRASYYWGGGRGVFAYSATPAVFDLIAMGILLYLVHGRTKGFLSRHKGVSGGLCLSGFALVIFCYLGTRENDNFSMIYTPEILGLGLFGGLLGGLHFPFFQSGLWKIPSLPGKYCYGCYLFNPLVVFFVRPYVASYHPFLAFLVLLTVVTILAAVSYHFFEMPVNRLIRKKWIASPAAFRTRKKFSKKRETALPA
jgi:peptidoglycan/LPS O-acetylase OafA/YrhL